MTSSRSDAHGPPCWLVFLENMVLTSTWFPMVTAVPELPAGASSRFPSEIKVPTSLFLLYMLPSIVESRLMPPNLVFCYMELEDNNGSGHCESFLFLVRMGTQNSVP